ncbi:hypothetical protein Thermo_01651 [Thermoplasmatales archaeon]|nr:hypothetical protein Thermo_01651 [Thermoplasmatales archaeon]
MFGLFKDSHISFTQGLPAWILEVRSNRLKEGVVQGRSFSELLDEAVKRYINRSIGSAQAIEELIELAKKMHEYQKREEKLHLTEDEVAFYDALANHKTAKAVLGDDTLKDIARE